MKLGRKAVAFITVFLMIFGNCFTLFSPVANASPTADWVRNVVVDKKVNGGDTDTHSFSVKIEKKVWDFWPISSHWETYGTYSVTAAANLVVSGMDHGTDYRLSEVALTSAETSAGYSYGSISGGDSVSGNYANFFFDALTNQTKNITINNSKATGIIQVTKSVGSETVQAGDSFLFKLYKGTTATGTPVQTKTVTAAGSFTFSGLDYGQYTLTEDSIGSFNGTPVFSGNISSNIITVGATQQNVTCTNSKLHGSIKVTKSVGTETVRSGDSFLFKLYQGTTATGNPVQTKTITAAGSFTFDNLEYGQYTLTEQSTGSFNGTPAFSGNINSSTGVITVGATQQVVTCTNSRLYGSIKVTKSVGSETVRQGDSFLFKLYQGTTATGTPVQTKTLTAAGSFTFDNLEYGQYTLTEQSTGSFNGAPAFSGDINSGTGVITVGAAQPQVICTNSRLYGSIKVTKTIGSGDEIQPGDSFTFNLYQGTTATGLPVRTQTLTAAGSFTFDNLEYGPYTLTEQSSGSFNGAPIFGGDIIGNVVTVGAAQQQVTCKNTKFYGSIKVTKSVGDETVRPGDSFTFYLYKGTTATGTPMRTQILTAAGSFTFDTLEYGPYTLTEQSAGSFNGTPAFGGDISGGVVTVGATQQQVTCQNSRLYGSITVTKKFTGTAPANDTTFTFSLWQNGAQVGSDKVLSWGHDNNQVKFDSLEYGTYIVKESPKPGYTLGTGFETGVSLLVNSDNPNPSIDCTNAKLYGSITLHKNFDGNTTAGAGDTFGVTVSGVGDTSYSQTVYLKANGDPETLNDLPYGGTFKITEAGKTGFQLVSIKGVGLDENNEFTVGGDQLSFSVTVTNKQLFGSIKVTKALANNVTDPNATFVFKLTMGSKVLTSSAIKAGDDYVFSGLEYGDYTISEEPSMGFAGNPSFSGDIKVNTSDTIAVDSQSEKDVACTNTKLFGSITINKTVIKAEGDESADPSFTVAITGPTNNPNTPSSTFTRSISAGSNTISGLDYGDYAIEEVNLPVGYQCDSISPTSFTVDGSVDHAVTINIQNTKHYGKITVTKAVNGPAPEGTTFTFSIWEGETQIGSDQTLTWGQNNNQIVFDAPDYLLEYGHTYTVKEAAVTGFAIDPDFITGKQVTINGQSMDNETNSINLTCTNTRLGSIKITKAMLGNYVGTPSFDFTLSGQGIETPIPFSLTPGANKLFQNLPAGEYMITEVPTTGYAAIGFTGGGTESPNHLSYTVSINSDRYDIQVTCTNQQLGRLQLTKKDSSNPNLYLSGAAFRVISVANPNNIFQLTTGQSGTILSDWLTPGNYTVQEIGAPAGYHIDDPSTRTVTVFPGSTTSDSLTIFTDSLGSIKVQKYSSFGNAPVEGVKFQLLRNPPQADGSVNNGDVAGEATTNANGVAWFYGLPVGSDFWVREIQQAPGFDIDKTVVFKVTASYNPAAASATFVNNPLGKVSITKYDAETINGSDYTNGTKLGGAVYGIYASTDYTKAPVATITTSNTGAVQSADLPFGGSNPASYYVKEITAPAGYLLSDTVQTVTFTTPGQVADLVFTNIRAVGSLVIKKVDALNPNQVLAGAEFTLYSDAALTTKAGAAVTTGADGIARFDNLEPGNYWLKETKAPTDYDPLTAAVPVTVAAGVTNPDPLVITNQYNPPKDIQTGTMDWNILLIGGLALMAGLLLVVFNRKRRMQANAK